MHSKVTVKYICEVYPSGNCYYYKQELITHDSWDNPGSICWSTPRPISKRTYLLRKKEGYKIEERVLTKQPAKIIPFKRGTVEQQLNMNKT
ncbi:hypothetical protein [Halalkalibacter urbisdiaboli]|uniref:hypothetical protein n=1 Tax=Halalkalibacter urbisdiaboli TaxID=1960589 RepID=UPI000B43AC65|nr:hypothetical protein [Halalkalibacter urbisdiaboli]